MKFLPKRQILTYNLYSQQAELHADKCKVKG
jgi:hypothetical protein